MADATPINLQAFQPYGGGRGLTLDASSTSVSGKIPGALLGGDPDKRRVQIINAGPMTAWVVMGPSGVVADDQCMMLPAGWWWIGTPQPNGIGTGELYLAVITRSGSAVVNAVAGTGT